MTSKEIIQKAIEMINEHDWWWAWAEYCAEPRSKAYAHMRAFAELASSINDCHITATLRQIWVISGKKAWTDDRVKKAQYQSMIDELMLTLQPSTTSMAA